MATQVLYLTGKGGVGKSFVARLLADVAASRGLRTALVRMHTDGAGDAVGNRVGAGAPDAGKGSSGAAAATVSLDQDRALRHLLTRVLRFRFLSNRLMDSRTFSAVASAAPGVKDLVTLSYLRDLAAGEVAPGHDLLIVDGVASGHSVPLLAAPRRVHELLRVSPAARVAADVETFVHDARRFRAVIVTLPEELCVGEAIELTADLDDLGVSMTRPIVNCIYPPGATRAQATWLREHDASDDSLLYLSRRERQLELATRLEHDGAQPLLFPFLFERHDSGKAAGDAAGRLLDELLKNPSGDDTISRERADEATP